MLKRKIRFLLFLVRQLFGYVLYFFSGFSKRDSRIWLFGCWNGQQFRGNSKVLFDYTTKNFPHIESIWITKNEQLYQRLRKEGFKVYLAFSLKGFLATLRAKYFFVTHGILDMNEYVSRKGVIVNLTHATYTIKKLYRFHGQRLSLATRAKYYLREPFGNVINPDYVITASEFTRRYAEDVFGPASDFRVPRNNILPLGTPKSDLLFSIRTNLSSTKQNETREEFDLDDKLIICFSPTIRTDPEFSLFNYNFNIEALSSLLHKFNGIMLFNFHPSSRRYNLSWNQPESNIAENIRFTNLDNNQIDKILGCLDILITDYSSIFADFLIFDKPIIFAKFGHETYRRYPGVSVDYDKFVPGPTVDDWPTLLNSIREICISKIDTFQRDREELRDLIHANSDGNSCHRITQFVTSLSD